MVSKNKDIFIEINCISECVAALEKLEKYYINKSEPGDSVAEAQAKKATHRILNYVVSRYH